ncbi:MAG: Rieske 2Fe-2S domain-containing protein [Rhodospirillaceae bacterium]|nr:Rieske 2Fe-2S domain-containing protein [Rhodospirillaceae bacterium]
MTHVLCRWADLDRTGAKEVTLDDAGVPLPVFVVRRGDGALGYVNSCPHVRLPLNWQDDVFFDVTRTYLLCANHGALFDVDTGRCVRGPCKGKFLRPFPVERQGEDIVARDWPL